MDWDKWAEQTLAKHSATASVNADAEKKAERERQTLETYALDKWKELQQAFQAGCDALNRIPRMSGHRFSIRAGLSGEFIINSAWRAVAVKLLFDQARNVVSVNGFNGLNYRMDAKLRVKNGSLDELYFADAKGNAMAAEEMAQSALDALLNHEG